MYSANIEEPITFSLLGSEPNAQYQARSILGLDNEEIIQKFYGASIDGSSKFYEYGLKARDIVMRVVLNPREILGETYSDIRDDLYRTISANRTGRVKLHFSSGGTVVSGIFGYISKFEVAYFNKLPEVQLTIRCNDPMFRAINPVRFENVELTSNPNIIPDTLSTCPHGFFARFTFISDVATFTMQDAEINPEWRFRIVPLGGFFTDDVLYISSEFANKYAYLIRGDDVLYLGDRIEPTSLWPVIFPFPNANTFWVEEAGQLAWDELEYSAAYWGV
jgi:hypothetical protein